MAIERGSDRAGADGRAGTAVGAKARGTHSSPFGEIALFPRGVNLPHRTLKDTTRTWKWMRRKEENEKKRNTVIQSSP